MGAPPMAPAGAVVPIEDAGVSFSRFSTKVDMVRKRDSRATAGVTGIDACRTIVGIGASAGGIETLGRLFDAMPADSGCAFVVILHLDPTRNSQLAPVLGRHTSMPVVEITDGMSLEPNRVHVIVPDRTLAISGGKLRLTKPAEPRGQRHPVDAFFVSMAGDVQTSGGRHRPVGHRQQRYAWTE